MADDELMSRLRRCSVRDSNSKQPCRYNNYHQSRSCAAAPWPLLSISRLFSLATRLAMAQTLWERCSSAMDLLHCLFFFGICMLRALLLHLFSLSLHHSKSPSTLQFCGSSPPWSPQSGSSIKPASNEVLNNGRNSTQLVRFDPLHFYSVADFRSEDLAIGRALFQVLRLMSEMPVAAPKYEFTRSLAERMLQLGGCCATPTSTTMADAANVGDHNWNMTKDSEHIRGRIRRRAAMEIALQAAFERAVRVLKDRMEQVERERVKEGVGDGDDEECGGWRRQRQGRGWWLWWWWWRRCAAAMSSPWKIALRRAGICGADGGGDEAGLAALLGFLLEEAGELMGYCLAAPPGHGAVMMMMGDAAGGGWEGRRRRLRSLEAAEAAAEKAAAEVLWLARRIHDCLHNRAALMHDATLTWSSAGRRLPALAVRAPLPRVQACLVRVCDLLFKDLNLKSTTEEHEKPMNGGSNNLMSLKAKLLVTWLPLFCNVRSSHDNPSFSPCEKLEILSNLEHMVASLEFWEQEIVLSCWLQLYTRSPYDWPNLHHCFQTWLSQYPSLSPFEQ